jgi:hypothetical protein
MLRSVELDGQPSAGLVACHFAEGVAAGQFAVLEGL